MKSLVLSTMVAAGLTFMSSISWSQMDVGEFLACGAGIETDYVSGGADHVTRFEFRGIIVHEEDDHSLHSAHVSCHGESHSHPTEGDILHHNGSCTVVDDEGHSFVFADVTDLNQDLVRRMVYGLGKWDGIDVDLSVETIAMTGPRSNGEYEVCLRVTEE